MFVAPEVPTHSVDVDAGIAKRFMSTYQNVYDASKIPPKPEDKANIKAFLSTYDTAAKSQAKGDAVNQSYAKKIYTRWISPYTDWIGLTGGAKGPDVELKKPEKKKEEDKKKQTNIQITITPPKLEDLASAAAKK